MKPFKTSDFSAVDLDIFEAIVRRRRSVRAYHPDPVPNELITWATQLAATAPSSCNTQPWSLHIVSGKPLAELRAALTRAAAAGERPARDVEYPDRYDGALRERQIDAATRLFRAQGIERDNAEGRHQSFLRNFSFFEAPHAAFIFMPPGSGPREAADCGKFIQTFMLALSAAGIGSCPQGSLSRYPHIVREIIKLHEPGLLLLGISFGYADEDHPTASVSPPRASLQSFCRFYG